MIEEGPRYHRAAEASAHICNLLSDNYPGGKVQLYGRILFLILEAMYQAESELHQSRLTPSEN